MKTKVLDLYCGLGGWAQAFPSSEYEITGYDIIDFSKEYPGKFIQSDILKPQKFPKCEILIASPPCTEFSKTTFPTSWQSVRKNPPDTKTAIKLFNRVFQVAKQTKPKYYIIENVRGAEQFMGKARMHIGSRYFWGNFPLFTSRGNDIYGKYKLPPSKDRPALRSKIPPSIASALESAIHQERL